MSKLSRGLYTMVAGGILFNPLRLVVRRGMQVVMRMS